MNDFAGRPWRVEDLSAGGGGYVPISLQYRQYTAENARNPNIAGGDPFEGFTNRTFKGKTITAFNESDLDLVLETRRLMKEKPVIVSISLSNPMVFEEFEKAVDSILVSFGVQDKVLLDIICRTRQPWPPCSFIRYRLL